MVNDYYAFENTLDSIARATLSIVQMDDLNEILQRIVDACRTTISAEYAVMGIYGEQKAFTEYVVSELENNKHKKIISPEISKSILKTIIKNNSTVRSEDAAQATNILERLLDFPPSTSFLGMSITAGDNVTGAIYLIGKEDGRSFSEIDEKVVEILTSYITVAVRKKTLRNTQKRNQQELKKRNAQLAALNQAAMAIAGELALDKVLQQIVDSARELLHAEYAALGVPNSDGYLEAFIYSGMRKEDALKIDHLPKGYGLLGAIYTEKKPIRIPKISADSRTKGFPANHPPMDSFLGVPIIAGDQTLGNLYLTNKLNANEFSLEDQELAVLLAAHAAIAIQNAQLYEQVGRLAIVEERTRIGMDLHDGIIQSIYAVGLTLESTRLALPLDATESNKMLGLAINGLNDTIRDIRNFILDLRPHRFSGNLHQGLARLIREFQANTMVMVTLKAPEESFNGLPTSIARAIFLTTQEALANVARHARASEVHIQIERNHSEITVMIEDDGQGFDMQIIQNRIGHGLSNMQSRMEELRGNFDLHSAPGQGTLIKLNLPLS